MLSAFIIALQRFLLPFDTVNTRIVCYTLKEEHVEYEASI